MKHKILNEETDLTSEASDTNQRNMLCLRHYSEEASQATAASVPGAPSLPWGLTSSLSQQGRIILPLHQVSQSPQLFWRKFCFVMNAATTNELTFYPVCFHSCVPSRRSWEVTHMITSGPEHHVPAAVLKANTALGPPNRAISRSIVWEGPKR